MDKKHSLYELDKDIEKINKNNPFRTKMDKIMEPEVIEINGDDFNKRLTLAIHTSVLAAYNEIANMMVSDHAHKKTHKRIMINVRDLIYKRQDVIRKELEALMENTDVKEEQKES